MNKMTNDENAKFLSERTAESAELFHERIMKLYEQDEEVKNIYRGIFVWQSLLIVRPDVMFLGINPGAGYYNHNHQKLVHYTKPIEINEYFDPKQDYQLKWEWQYVFGEKGLNRLDLLEKSVKTNFCWYATENLTQLKRLFVILKAKTDINQYELFGMHTEANLCQIKPKLLICEGATTYDWLKQWSKCENFVIDDEKTQNFTLGHILFDNLETKVLQVNRVFSTIKGIDEIIKKIKELLEI